MSLKTTCIPRSRANACDKICGWRLHSSHYAIGQTIVSYSGYFKCRITSKHAFVSWPKYKTVKVLSCGRTGAQATWVVAIDFRSILFNAAINTITKKLVAEALFWRKHALNVDSNGYHIKKCFKTTKPTAQTCFLMAYPQSRGYSVSQLVNQDKFVQHLRQANDEDN